MPKLHRRSGHNLLLLCSVCHSNPVHFVHPGGNIHQQQRANIFRALYRDGLPGPRRHHLRSGHFPREPVYWTAPVLPHLLLHR